MQIWEGILLGLLQGITEFLPVSSSGHLVLMQILLGAEGAEGAVEQAVLHLGTLLAVLIYFWKSLLQMLQATLRGLTNPRKAWSEDSHFRLAAVIAVASLPAGGIGWFFQDSIEALFRDPFLVSTALIGTGLAVLSTRWVGRGEITEVGAFSGFGIGVAQAVAILPGVSRSGTTIACARWLGVCEEEAGRFSFLLSIPVVAGAGGLKLVGLLREPDLEALWVPLGLGAMVALGSGLLALHLLLGLVRRRQFWIFGPYCLVLGVVGIVGLSFGGG